MTGTQSTSAGGANSSRTGYSAPTTYSVASSANRNPLDPRSSAASGRRSASSQGTSVTPTYSPEYAASRQSQSAIYEEEKDAYDAQSRASTGRTGGNSTLSSHPFAEQPEMAPPSGSSSGGTGSDDGLSSHPFAAPQSEASTGWAGAESTLSSHPYAAQSEALRRSVTSYDDDDDDDYDYYYDTLSQHSYAKDPDGIDPFTKKRFPKISRQPAAVEPIYEEVGCGPIKYNPYINKGESHQEAVERIEEDMAQLDGIIKDGYPKRNENLRQYMETPQKFLGITISGNSREYKAAKSKAQDARTDLAIEEGMRNERRRLEQYLDQVNYHYTGGGKEDNNSL